MRAPLVALALAAIVSTGCSEIFAESADSSLIRLSAASTGAVAEIQVVNRSGWDFDDVRVTPCAGGDTVSLGAAPSRVGITRVAVVPAGCSHVIAGGAHAYPEIPLGKRATVRFVDLSIGIPRP